MGHTQVKGNSGFLPSYSNIVKHIACMPFEGGHGKGEEDPLNLHLSYFLILLSLLFVLCINYLVVPRHFPPFKFIISLLTISPDTP